MKKYLINHRKTWVKITVLLLSVMIVLPVFSACKSSNTFDAFVPVNLLPGEATKPVSNDPVETAKPDSNDPEDTTIPDSNETEDTAIPESNQPGETASHETDTNTQNEISKNEDEMFFKNLVFDRIFENSKKGFEYFDFSTANPDFVYTEGNAENESLFSKILSGEVSYTSNLNWFISNPEYIYRYNEAQLKCAEAVIEAGAFTEELRAKYFGLFISNSTTPFLPASEKNEVHYQIYFNDDWSIKDIRQSIMYFKNTVDFANWYNTLPGYTLGFAEEKIYESEVRQKTNWFEPIYDQNGEYTDLFLSFSDTYIYVDMKDGKYADCSVYASYYRDPITSSVWNGEKQKHEEITYRSECKINPDFNNCYLQASNEVFQNIIMFTTKSGEWDLKTIWDVFKSVVLKPTETATTLSMQKVIVF